MTCNLGFPVRFEIPRQTLGERLIRSQLSGWLKPGSNPSPPREREGEREREKERERERERESSLAPAKLMAMLARILFSKAFDSLSSFVILANTIYMAYQADRPDENMPKSRLARFPMRDDVSCHQQFGSNSTHV